MALQDYAAQCGLFAGLLSGQRINGCIWLQGPLSLHVDAGYGAETEDVGINTEVEAVATSDTHTHTCGRLLKEGDVQF